MKLLSPLEFEITIGGVSKKVSITQSELDENKDHNMLLVCKVMAAIEIIDQYERSGS